MFFERGHIEPLRYVDRGDVGSYDYSTDDFTKDNNWHDLDISSKIPAGTKAIVCIVWAQSYNPTNVVYFAKKGDTNYFNISTIITQQGGIGCPQDIIIMPDTDGWIKYRATGTQWQILTLVIKGYFI